MKLVDGIIQTIHINAKMQNVLKIRIVFRESQYGEMR